MAKKIIILNRLRSGDESYNYVLWADVPSGRESAYADAGKTSAYKGTTADELTALQTGTVVERTGTLVYHVDEATQLQPDLENLYTQFQAEIDAANPTEKYGTFFDGTAWTDAGTP